MEISYDSVKQSQEFIKNLLIAIENATEGMNKTFQETIFRHQQQFMKTYKLKISELVKLFEELKSTIQDKFINNTLAIQLQTVLKERDYFKYECLKLNSQYKNLLEDHKNLMAQIGNTTEQVNIYRHLLQTQKIRSNEIGITTEKLKKDLHQISSRHIPQIKISHDYSAQENQRELIKVKRQIRQKNEMIRALKQRMQQLQKALNYEQDNRLQKKQLSELFKVCVDGWKRQIVTKNKRPQTKVTAVDQLSSLNKKQLLKIFFTHTQFLRFIDRLIFDDGFKVIFQSTQEHYLQRNRQKLLNYMNKRRIYTSSRACKR